jgi:hypothetical protein
MSLFMKVTAAIIACRYWEVSRKRFSCRFVGQNWKDSLTIGALMNTRVNGLIVLNIGLELKVLTQFCDDGNNGIGNNFHDRSCIGFY